MVASNQTKTIKLHRSHLRNGTVIAILIITLSGCVSVHWKGESGIVQHRGFLWYSVVNNENARIFQVETLGLQLRLQKEDPGLSLGYRKYIALKPPTEVSTDKINISGFLWAEDLVSDDASLRFKKQLGLEVGGAPLANGLSLGFDHITVVQGPPNGGSMVRKIDFFENDLQHSKVFQSTGGIQE